MADPKVRISELTAANPTLASLLPHVVSGATRRATAKQLLDLAAHRDRFVLVDEFFNVGPGQESGEIGELGWAMPAGALAVVAPVAAHPGVVNLSTTGTINTVARLTQQGTVAIPNDIDEIEFIVRPASGTTNMRTRLGLFVDPSQAGEAGQGAYFSFITGTSANWRAVTRDGVGITATDTTIAYATATWYSLLLKITPSTKVEFYVNGVLRATHTTNLALATAMFAAFVIENTEAVAKTIDIDRFTLVSQTLGQRWT